MKRDDDLLRSILFELEEEEDIWSTKYAASLLMSPEERRRLGHVLLLADAGLLAQEGHAVRLTASGHDYLDAIRNDNIWKRTKDGAAAVGGVTLGILRDIATSYLRQEIAAKLGITL